MLSHVLSPTSYALLHSSKGIIHTADEEFERKCLPHDPSCLTHAALRPYSTIRRALRCVVAYCAILRYASPHFIGEAKCAYKAGLRYTGLMRNGEFEGRGRLVFGKKGGWYDGEYKLGRQAKYLPTTVAKQGGQTPPRQRRLCKTCQDQYHGASLLTAKHRLVDCDTTALSMPARWGFIYHA